MFAYITVRLHSDISQEFIDMKGVQRCFIMYLPQEFTGRDDLINFIKEKEKGTRERRWCFKKKKEKDVGALKGIIDISLILITVQIWLIIGHKLLGIFVSK